MRSQTRASLTYLCRYRASAPTIHHSSVTFRFEIAIEQQMKTPSRLSYLLSQLIPTLGCLLLSCQHWERQVENGIFTLLSHWTPHSVFFFYSCLFLIEINLPACILRGHRERGKIKKNGKNKVGSEGGEKVRIADMLIVRDKHYSAVVILGETMTSLAC